MTAIVLRLGAPLQSWSGYRHAVNMKFVAPTEALPRKSAVNGIVGAALGPVDRGLGSARALDDLGERYTLHVRVDARNAPTEDFQVLAALPPRAHAGADRHHRVAHATTSSFPANRGGGSFPTTVGRRDFLAHSDFVAVLETDEATAQGWIAALRRPVFMPYLGRRSCAPTFPFVLGLLEGSVSDLFEHLPWVDRYRVGSSLRGFEVAGHYDSHRASEHPLAYSPPTGPRAAQLAWAKENLR